MVTRKKFASKPEWLLARKGKIGGSDAAAVLGLNPYKNNVEFWNEMVGITKPRDISNEPYVIYGTKAEEHIRAIFALDHRNTRSSTLVTTCFSMTSIHLLMHHLMEN